MLTDEDRRAIEWRVRDVIAQYHVSYTLACEIVAFECSGGDVIDVDHPPVFRRPWRPPVDDAYHLDDSVQRILDTIPTCVDDRMLAVPLYGLPPCLQCVHLHSRAIRSCAAFDVIPAGIWAGHYSHRLPWRGDGGVRFERAEL